MWHTDDDPTELANILGWMFWLLGSLLVVVVAWADKAGRLVQ